MISENLIVQRDTIIPIDETQNFTVNLALEEVFINGVAACALRSMFSAAPDVNLGNKWFAKNDNLNLLSIGLIFPHGFIQGTRNHTISLGWREETSALSSFVREVGNSGLISIPLENVEIALSIYLPWPAKALYPTFTDAYRKSLEATILLNTVAYNWRGGTVSMIGVPAALAAHTYPIVPFVKIEHNTALGA